MAIADERFADAVAEESGGKERSARLVGYKYRAWYPRFWEGMFPTAWFPLLVRNRFCIAPCHCLMALVVSCCTLFNFVAWLVQAVLLGRKIAKTRLQADPIFIIGHWRAGTTLLHELLTFDGRHTYPDTYQCFSPNHFLLLGWFFRLLLRGRLPKSRPMDNMRAGWDCPQEDEFALCNMGVPSPYLTIAFPNRPSQYDEYFDLEHVSPRARRRWQRGLLWFLKCITVRNPKRIVLKSPTHTSRIRLLLEMFPRAQFVHIVRDPFVLFPSTVHLWDRLCDGQALQTPRPGVFERRVFDNFHRMYEAFQRDRHLIPPTQFCELRYEDLIADPLGQMQAIYEQLQLEDFEKVRPAIEAYFAQRADYQTSRYTLSAELRAEVARRWGWYAQKYGYAADAEGQAATP